MMKQYWKIALALVVIFTTGAGLGYVGGTRSSKSQYSRMRTSSGWHEMMMDRLDQQVQLTPEQKEQIEPLLKTTGEEINRIRREYDQKNWGTIRAFYQQVETLLTEEQRQLLEESRRRIRERLKNSPGFRPGGPGFPGPGHSPDGKPPRPPQER